MMRFFAIFPRDRRGYVNGEWRPYPDDLLALHDGTLPARRRIVNIKWGYRLADMLFSCPNVISPRFATLLESQNATGYRTFKAALVKKGELLSTYHGLIVTGRGGKFDAKRSNAVFSKTGFLQSCRGFFMDETQWDGSDIFFVPDHGISLFASERISAVLRTARLKNVELIENHKLNFPPDL